MKSKIKQSYNINEAKILIKNNYSYEALIMAQKQMHANKQKHTHTLSSQAHIRPTKNKERKHKSHEKYKIKNKEENIKEAMKSIKSKDQNPLLK